MTSPIRRRRPPMPLSWSASWSLSRLRRSRGGGRLVIPLPAASGPLGILFSTAEAAAIGVEPRLEARLIQDGAVDDAARHPAMLDVEHGFHVGRAVAGEALVSPAQGVRRQDHIVELEDRIRSEEHTSEL